jgi:hypothetical protein
MQPVSMHDSTARLVKISEHCSNDTNGTVPAIASCLLALPDGVAENWRGNSGINSDGSPLQFSLSSSRDGVRSRLLGDPACMVLDLKKRYRLGHQALTNLLPLTGTNELGSHIQAMLNFHLGENEEHTEEYPDGVLWLGAATGSAGIAVYMDARRGGPGPAAERVISWMHELMPDAKKIKDVLGGIFKNASLMSLGLEGSSLKNMRAKIYWRMNYPDSLDSYDVPLLASSGMKDFLTRLIDDKVIQTKSIVFSAGFHVASQQLFDVKADVCNCMNCLAFANEQWIGKLDEFCRRDDIAPFPVSQVLNKNECSVAFFGMGLNIKNEKRYNIYLKGPRYE